jgi:predicted deacetylase
MQHGFAKYLVRFDDICPTMNWHVWNRVEELLLRYKIRPMLAVVPDNQDPNLRVNPAERCFWEHVRRWQARGWAIGLHGYQHRYVTKEPGIVPVNRRSEFAGLPMEQQETKLRLALEIFARENVTPDVWIAPAHSFDVRTMAVLCRLELRVICDGFFLWPHTDNLGIFWIPQQLWGFRRRPVGVWTVCHHHNAWGLAEISKFEEDLERYHRAILSFDAIRSAYAGRKKGLVDLAFPKVYRPATIRAAMLKGFLSKKWRSR